MSIWPDINQLIADGAPDAAFRRLLSTWAAVPLQRGETWRHRAERWAARQARGQATVEEWNRVQAEKRTK